MSWSGWYLRNSSISAILRSVIGVVTPFRLLVVLLLEGNAPVTFSVNHRPDSTGFYTLPGTLTLRPDHPFALAASEVLEQVSGQGVLGGFPAGCDARILSGVGKTPSIIYGPGSLLDAHAVDESVSI